MTVSIHPHLWQFIEEQIKAGRYQTPDEVVNSALAHLSAQVELPPEDLEELRGEVAIGVAELDRGEGKEWDPEELWDEVERRHAAQARPDEKRAG
jgi:antitoxin ParD1/3/4